MADNFFDGAKVAAEFEYWNAAGVLIVHSAIALGDAITVKYGGVKSKGEEHQQLINLVDNIIAESPGKKKGLLQLSKLIAHKNSVSYSGDIYYKKDFDQMMKHFNRFSNWIIEANLL